MLNLMFTKKFRFTMLGITGRKNNRKIKNDNPISKQVHI